MPGLSEPQKREHLGWETFKEDWFSIGEPFLILDICLVLLVALALGAMIAYHPSARRRVTTLEQYEQPKTFLMYAMVAAVVALIVQVEPAMALVVFGIGGLLRFRTMVGEAHETGRVILVTVVGLCCGLKIFIVAIPATLIGWLIIYFLEGKGVGIIRVSGVPEDKFTQATESYRSLIHASQCRVIGEETKFIKRQFSFVVAPEEQFDRAKLAKSFSELSEELQGKVDWERL